jgi:alpha-amylase/alpha-mannosidase (GH57 family)
MPKIYLCFVWHMHQPFYKDLITGQYKMPWTRLHALKDYYGMVKILDGFPEVHQTFNLVPSMLVQIEEYAAGTAVEPFYQCAFKPAEELTEAEQSFILQYFFQANVERMIRRYPRYGELYDAFRAADQKPERARRLMGPQAFRDLQVLSQLAWFDEEFIGNDPDVRRLAEKGRNYNLGDQELVRRKETEIVGATIPAYRKAAERGQIEISTTPFYHPILPLLCDSDIASVSHPGVPLPSRFRYPQDARRQLETARQYMAARFGRPPVGLWPSEGSVSDEALGIAADVGLKWIATDNGVLSRTLGTTAGVQETYRPYLWRQGGRQIHAIFRDHFLSDLIGFVYSRMDAAGAAADFLRRIKENCRPILAQGRDALAPIILDGENAWEYYPQNGRPFLRELYARISSDPEVAAVTVSEALEKIEPAALDGIFPGSWINANFDVWIGAEEDNKAWEYLLQARRTYDGAVAAVDPRVSAQEQQLALEELLIAEGSDWCWWYGPEHDSATRPEFDQLFRDHLANVYRALHKTPPEELSRPILKVAAAEYQVPPAGPIRPSIDGLATSYFEWLGAGVYRVDEHSGAMHGTRDPIRELYYGSDGQNLYLRADFESNSAISGLEARINIQGNGSGPPSSAFTLRFEDGKPVLAEQRLAAPPGSGDAGVVEFAFDKVLEVRFSLAAMAWVAGQPIRFQVSLWRNGLPLDAIPPQGWLEFTPGDQADWPL